MPKHSIVLPAYNERERLPAYLDDWVRVLDGLAPGDYEIVVVDDGSRDGTREYVRERMASVPALKLLENATNRGKGFSVRRGMLEARGALRLFADSDGATPAAEYGRLLERMEKERVAIVIGARIPLRGVSRVQRSLRRHYVGRVFATLVGVLSGLHFYDTQCGFKLFTAEAVEAIFPRVECTRWAFDVEVLMLAERLGFDVAEMPVNWSEQPGSKVRVWRAAPQMVRDILAMRRRHRGIGPSRA